MKKLLILYLWIVATLALAQTYTNPVVTPVAADPSIIRAPDGSFYLYATQDDWDDGQGSHYLPIFKSDDLVTWTYLKDVFTVPPNWKESGGFTWAPDISYHDGRYYLYYAYSLWGDPDPCIALATAEQPEGPWTDLGRAVFCSKDIGVENSIDPFVWDEDGTRTLVWGSFHGIYAVALSDDGTRGSRVTKSSWPPDPSKALTFTLTMALTTCSCRAVRVATARTAPTKSSWGARKT